MTNREGIPIWYELITDDPDAAQTFYGPIMGWNYEKQRDSAERDYRVFTATDQEGIGGIMRKPAGAQFAPSWFVYFGVDDVDASTKKVRSLGGTVHMEPNDIPNVGRISFVADPQGACFYLMRGDSGRVSTAFNPMSQGHCCWNELVSTNQQAALEFYSKLFGWTSSGAMPMGDQGDYTFVQHGDLPLGAMMDAPDKASFWNFAFTVDDIDTARSSAGKDGPLAVGGVVDVPPFVRRPISEALDRCP